MEGISRVARNSVSSTCLSEYIMQICVCTCSYIDSSFATSKCKVFCSNYKQQKWIQQLSLIPHSSMSACCLSSLWVPFLPCVYCNNSICDMCVCALCSRRRWWARWDWLQSTDVGVRVRPGADCPTTAGAQSQCGQAGECFIAQLMTFGGDVGKQLLNIRQCKLHNIELIM